MCGAPSAQWLVHNPRPGRLAAHAPGHPELTNMHAGDGASDRADRNSYSAFGLPDTKWRSRSLRTSSSMGYAKQCMNMRKATSAIRQCRACPAVEPQETRCAGQVPDAM